MNFLSLSQPWQSTGHVRACACVCLYMDTSSAASVHSHYFLFAYVVENFPFFFFFFLTLTRSSGTKQKHTTTRLHKALWPPSGSPDPDLPKLQTPDRKDRVKGFTPWGSISTPLLWTTASGRISRTGMAIEYWFGWSSKTPDETRSCKHQDMRTLSVRSTGVWSMNGTLYVC